MTDLEKLAAETLATWMHHQYQRIALEEGWQVQSNTAGEFADLPEANKRVMVRMASNVHKLLFPAARAAGRIEGMEEAAASICHECKKGTPFHVASGSFAFHLDSGGTIPCGALNIRARIKELKGEVSEA